MQHHHSGGESQYRGSATHTFWYYYHFAGEAAVWGLFCWRWICAANNAIKLCECARGASTEEVCKTEYDYCVNMCVRASEWAIQSAPLLRGVLCFETYASVRSLSIAALYVCFMLTPRHRAHFNDLWLIDLLFKCDTPGRHKSCSRPICCQQGVWKVNKM